MDVVSVLVARESQVFRGKAAIYVMVQYNEIVSLSYPRCVPVWVPSIPNVNWELVSLVRREGGSDGANSIFIPSQKGVTVGWFVKKFKTHDIGNGE